MSLLAFQQFCHHFPSTGVCASGLQLEMLPRENWCVRATARIIDDAINRAFRVQDNLMSDTRAT